MSSPEYQEMYLANLPSDVIRRIIQVGQESLNGMTLISPRWRELASEHLGDRKRLPVINFIHWELEQSGIRNVSLLVPRKFRNYFGFEEVLRNANGVDANEQLEICLRRNVIDNRFLAQLFGRCSYIESFELNADIHQRTDEIDFIIQSIGDAITKELTFTNIGQFTEDSANAVLDLFRALQVRQINFRTRIMFDFYCLLYGHKYGAYGYDTHVLFAEASRLGCKFDITWIASHQFYMRLQPMPLDFWADEQAARTNLRARQCTEVLNNGEIRCRVTLTPLEREDDA